MSARLVHLDDLRHSMVYFQGLAAPRLDYQDVVITRSPPGVRDYSGEHK